MNTRSKMRYIGLVVGLVLFSHSSVEALPVSAGDVNGDHTFDSSDLIKIFESGKYDTEEFALYSEGDVNHDAKLDSADLLSMFQAGSYGAPLTESVVLSDFETQGTRGEKKLYTYKVKTIDDENGNLIESRQELSVNSNPDGDRRTKTYVYYRYYDSHGRPIKIVIVEHLEMVINGERVENMESIYILRITENGVQEYEEIVKDEFSPGFNSRDSYSPSDYEKYALAQRRFRDVRRKFNDEFFILEQIAEDPIPPAGG